jgi:hypothetical protein
LLGRLGESYPPGYKVNIGLRQIGDYVVISGGVAADRERRALTKSESALMPASHRGYGLSLHICQRVFKLHGGKLKIDYGEPISQLPGSAQFIESFTLTLPTGLPADDRSRASCVNCRIIDQTLQTARATFTSMANHIAKN